LFLEKQIKDKFLPPKCYIFLHAA